VLPRAKCDQTIVAMGVWLGNYTPCVHVWPVQGKAHHIVRHEGLNILDVEHIGRVELVNGRLVVQGLAYHKVSDALMFTTKNLLYSANFSRIFRTRLSCAVSSFDVSEDISFQYQSRE
jgi:hypothetical protein